MKLRVIEGKWSTEYHDNTSRNTFIQLNKESVTTYQTRREEE